MRKKFNSEEEELEYLRQKRLLKIERDRQYYYTVVKHNPEMLKKRKSISKEHYEKVTKANPAKMRDRKIKSKKYYYAHVRQKRKSHADITEADQAQ